MNLGPLVAAAAFARTRWISRGLRTREDVARHQARQVAALLVHAKREFDFYKGSTARVLGELAVVDKALVLSNFALLNSGRLSIPELREVLARGEERIRGFVIGQSTGTSGNRGYYVITDAERFVWLGTLLAKALPDALWRRHRVALALPGLSRLYRSASSGGRIALAFYDLADGVDSWIDAFSTFDPDTVVAPPKVLRRLAESGRLRARHVFSGSEVLDPLDREIIEARSGTRVREIYMATEGLFGVACEHGTLHLAEDVVSFELQRAGVHSELFTPLVTDFTRRAQAMIRYRMNDLLALSHAPCPCGSPLQAVARIEGRNDDAFWLHTPAGTWRMMTPDVVRNTIVDTSPLIRDFRAVQVAPNAIEITLDNDVSAEVERATMQALEARLATFGGKEVKITAYRGIVVPFDQKLRRVRRAWTPPAEAYSQK